MIIVFAWRVYIYKINLNLEINSNFRNVVNDYINFSVIKTYKNRKFKKYYYKKPSRFFKLY